MSDVLIGKVRRGELWSKAPGPRRRNAIPRLAPIATLVLSGLRIGELCGLRGGHMDFARRRISITRDITKTDAGVRAIPMTPLLREILIEHRATSPYEGADSVFRARTGRPQSPQHVRNRILTPARERANELLRERDQVPIGDLTQHTLRRTSASVALVSSHRNLRQVMRMLGHTNPQLTMKVYAQLLELGGAEYEAYGQRVDQLVEGTLDVPETTENEPSFDTRATLVPKFDP